MRALWEKEKMLITSIFLRFPQCFLLYLKQKSFTRLSTPLYKKPFEDIVGKGENADSQRISPFPANVFFSI